MLPYFFQKKMASGFKMVDKEIGIYKLDEGWYKNKPGFKTRSLLRRDEGVAISRSL